MHTESEPTRFVWLTGGRPVPVAAVEIALDLERRGIRMWQEGEHLLLQGRDLTDADLDRVRPWKPHILAILAYTPSDAHLWDGGSRRPSTPTAPATTRRTQ
ncbi:MAG: hypothetical protein AB7H88_08180 [Vicinamibacterales bacterium]